MRPGYAYPDLWTKAAALLQSILKNHALVDGNKRLGWLATPCSWRLEPLDTFTPMGESEDDASLRAWLRQWGECVATVEFDEAATLFDPSVVGFGTRAEVAVGLERLMAEQWRLVWPAISGFAFDVDGAHLLIAGDRKQAVIATTWSSTGRRADGTTGLRPGRATIVVRRNDEASPWRGIHTHFSLAPDAPGPPRRPSARR